MSQTINDLEKAVNSGLSTAIKKSTVNFGQLLIEIKVEDLLSTILFLKTNEKCKFKQLIDITAVDYPQREERFKIVYLFLSHENNLRLLININVEDKISIPSITKIFPSAIFPGSAIADPISIVLDIVILPLLYIFLILLLYILA